MLQTLLAETTAATNQPDGGANTLATILIMAVVFFLLLAIMDRALNGGGAAQPPAYPPACRGERAPMISRPSLKPPINLDLEIDRMEIVRGPRAGSGPRRPLN